MTIRRLASTALIRLGPNNPLVFGIIRHLCGRRGAELYRGPDYFGLRQGRREMRVALRFFVYAPDLAGQFDCFFHPLVATEHEGLQVLDFSHPGLHTYARTGLQFELASFPEEDDAIESYFHWYIPQSGDLVFDIGAYCGVSTYEFAKRVGPSGQVIAFEPDPTNFDLLLRNLERHSLINVVPVQLAIAGKSGLFPFHAEQSLGSGLAHVPTPSHVGQVVQVEAITLSEAFARWGVPRFCKIDIEGAELEVLDSAVDHLAKMKCDFAVDTGHTVGSSPTYRRVEAIFRRAGYRAASSAEGPKTTWATCS